MRVEISDEGPGIDRKKGEILFNKERRLKSVKGKRKDGGHGLGLAISRDIIKSLGGKIGYRSTKEKGTTFFVEIPKDFESSL